MLVEILPVVDGCLIGAVSLLSGIVWQQRRQLSLLQTDQVLLASKLRTIEQQTWFDALTGLRNQRMFEAMVSTLLRGTEPFALIYIDLDGLKAVNDRLGHPVGDELIRRAVKAIRSAVRRRSDLDGLFRRGGRQEQRAQRDGRNCVRCTPAVIEHCAPVALSPGHTLDAILVEIHAERTQRHAA